MSRGLAVSLDGPGSSGKSSAGAAAARQLGYRFMDTGILYRGLTWLALQRGVNLEDAAALVALIPELEVVPDDVGQLRRIRVGGRDVTEALHTPQVEASVSQVARQEPVRSALLPLQRELAEPGRIIMAGRDIGTVVLPDADLKLYLDVSVEERARRRAEERRLGGDTAAARELEADLRRRDEIDSTRQVAPLRVPEGARLIGGDDHQLEDTVAEVVELVRRRERELGEGESEGERDGGDNGGSGSGSDNGSGSGGDNGSDGGDNGGSGSDNGDMTDQPQRPRRLPLIPRFLAFLARLFFRATTRITVEGAENLPQEGPLIVTPNHLSNADPPLIAGWVAPALGRRPRFLAKGQLFVPVVGHFLRWQGAIPVKAGGRDPDTYRVIKKLLDQGEALIIFPEGTRNPEGVIGRALPGAALLATRTGVPVLPVGISGTDRFLGRGSPLPKIGARITVRIGRPYTLTLNPDLPRREALAAADAELLGRIAALVDERHRGRHVPVT